MIAIGRYRDNAMGSDKFAVIDNRITEMCRVAAARLKNTFDGKPSGFAPLTLLEPKLINSGAVRTILQSSSRKDSR